MKTNPSIKLAKGARRRGPFAPIEQAIKAIRAGEIIIVCDDEDRENEGDLTMAASKVSAEAVNFMVKHGRGLVCLAMTPERLDALCAHLVHLGVRHTGPVTHTGGDRCTDGVNAAPCKDLIDWWHVEFGEDVGSGQKLGRITDVTALGKVYGYAFDPADTTQAVTVKFYADGDKDTGTAAGSTVANFDGSDGNTAGRMRSACSCQTR